MNNMKKITAADPESHSADQIAQNLDYLKALFPEAFIEGKIDFDLLRQLLGAAIDDREEKYGLGWHGKRRARQLALTLSTGTLRPCPEESVDWDTTQNLMIEGDNLEVLKLLQKSYARKVKLIYIDPPYNTGGDFVYEDSYNDGIENYLRITGQVENGGRIATNTEASGRFHTRWLNMMYPRLKIARNLLSESGFLFVSVDDGEVANLRHIANEIFGEENFVAQLVWKSRVSEDTRAKTGVSTDHEYILCYSRGNDVALRGSEKDLEKFDNPDNDPRGPWRSADLTGLATKDARPNLHYDLIDPKTRINYGCPPKGWRYEKATMDAKIAEGRILFPPSRTGRPRHKLFLKELRSLYKNISSVLTEYSTADGTREINELLGSGVFSFPKPVALVASIIEQATTGSDIVMDFFAGSGTTGHATMLRNALDGTNRRYILVQLPEELEEQNAARFCDKLKRPRRLSEITKERLRRSAKQIKKEHKKNVGDLGFRVLRLDSSNIQEWEPDAQDIEGSLQATIEHLKPERTEMDILYELLLKLGLDVCVPLERRAIGKAIVFAVASGTLITCLAEKIETRQVEELASGIRQWVAELRPAGDPVVVVRDAAFENDIAKTNFAAILEQCGIKNVRSV